MKHIFNKLVCAASLVVFALNAKADKIYDSGVSGFNGNAFTMVSGQEIGNEVVLSGNWSLSGFDIEYYAPNALASTIGLEINIFANNGPVIPTSSGYQTPGSLIFSSGFYYGLPGGQLYGEDIHYSSADFAAGGFASPSILPSAFTFTVTYTNSDGSGNLDGLQSPLADSPSGQPGQSFGDYWLDNNGTWELLTTPGHQDNLLVDFEGTIVTTPEPSVFALGAIGGVLFLGINKLRRKH